MLLVVALIASIIGWRTAVEQERRENRYGERRMLQSTVAQLEKAESRWEEQVPDDDDDNSHYRAARLAIKMLRSQISDMNQRIDELTK